MNRLAKFLATKRNWLIATFQSVLVFGSLVLAWLLRFEFSLPQPSLLLSAGLILVVIRIAAISRFHLMHGWWRYSGLNDAVNIIKAVAVGTVAFAFVMRILLGVTFFPRSVYFFEAVLTTGVLAGVRLLSRAVSEFLGEVGPSAKRVLLIGAGFAAQMIIRETNRQDSGYQVVGCVDDDPSKRGLRVHGIPVLGSVEALPEYIALSGAQEVLIAVPSATSSQMQRFVEICQSTGVRFRTVPALREVLAGQVIMNQLRDVDLEDLLGREPVELDLESVRQKIAGRRVVVTGAAGSIGSELCRQVLEYGPSNLLCIDHNENGIFYLRQAFNRSPSETEIVFRVGNVGDLVPMSKLFLEFQPQIVFHAAAHKHVPIMELSVSEAVRNNVFGLLNLLEASEKSHVEDFVLISSDKAVNPANVMGATKRIAELILSSRKPNGMRCASVRFGNVLGSNGSVVPILQEQLRNGQPLTVTHKDIKRYFMTTREAVALVLQAFAIGSHGDILVLDMGKPVRIYDLAQKLIRLSGKPEQEGQIQIIGLREGEKLHEELFYSSEEICSTSCEKIKRTRSRLMGWSQLHSKLEKLRSTLTLDGPEPIRAQIKEIVPEYVPANLPKDESKQDRHQTASAD